MENSGNENEIGLKADSEKSKWKLPVLDQLTYDSTLSTEGGTEFDGTYFGS